jgi:hypothetical protein
VILRYEPDPALEFTKLPEQEDFEDVTQEDITELSGNLSDMQHRLLVLEHLFVASERSTQFAGYIQMGCSALPELLCAGFCINNPLRIACEVTAGLIMLGAQAVHLGAEIAYQVYHHSYTKATLAPGDEIAGFKYSEATAKNFKHFAKWNNDALQTININMMKQHTQMRKNVQDRHTEMLNCILCRMEDDKEKCTKFCEPKKEGSSTDEKGENSEKGDTVDSNMNVIGNTVPDTLLSKLNAIEDKFDAKIGALEKKLDAVLSNTQDKQKWNKK